LKNAISAFGRAKNKSAAKRHIMKRAKELGKENLLPNSWKGMKTQDDLEENSMSHSKVHGKLQECLDCEYGEYNARVHDVYPGFVVYGRTSGSGEKRAYKLHKQDYKIDKRKNEEDAVSLTGESSEVKRHVEYRTPDGAFVGNSDGAPRKGKAMASSKKKLVSELIANSEDWEPEDREFLMTKDDGWLKKQRKKAGLVDEPVTNAAATSPAPEVKKPQTLQEYVANSGAPPEIQEVFNESLASLSNERTKLVDLITANSSNKFTKEELASMKTGMLRNLASLANNGKPAEAGAGVYSGLGFFAPPVAPQEDAAITANAAKVEPPVPLSTKPEKKQKVA
jgi:hypothetical protein